MSLPVTKVTEQKTINFNNLDISLFVKQLEAAVKSAKAEIANLLLENETITFDNTVIKLDFIGQDVNKLSSLFFNLNSVRSFFK